MKTLFLLNDPPHGTERCYNALRLASALLKRDPGSEATVFLMADASSPQGPVRRPRMAITMSSGC